MKAGDIFEHPIKETGNKVKLIAISSEECTGCIFEKGRCKSESIGRRHHDLTGSCSVDKVIYQLYEPKKIIENGPREFI